MISLSKKLLWNTIIYGTIIFVILQIQRYLFKVNQNYYYLGSLDNVKNKLASINKNEYAIEKGETVYKKILIWTDYFQRKNVWQIVFQRHFTNECEETRCEFTLDKSQHDVADAVLFEGNSLELDKPEAERFVYPTGRKPHQIYIFFSTEPPTRYYDVKLENYNNFFNWTMTYRRDSDVVVPYGVIAKSKSRKKFKFANEKELKRKKFAVFLNSHNCEFEPRFRFINSLQRYIEIDKFGRCYNRICGEVATVNLTIRTPGEDVCERSFNNYVFFMALENSMCRDYVTEKFYRSLKLGIIPVTLGSVNYSEFAPPHSFIDATEFETESHLALYLKKVANNLSLYNKYLNWQEHYDIDVGTPYKPLICDLCKKLHSPLARMKKVYKNIKDWYIKGGNCSNVLIRNTS